MTATLTPAIPFSCINADLDEPVLLECHQGTVCTYSRRSPDKTTPNEDAIAVVSLGDDHLVCIVADGLGGQPSGEQASALTIGLLIDRLSATRHAPGNIIQVILGSIEAANRELLDAAVGAATTLAIAEIHGSAVRSYHVGDSMILVTGQRGKVKLETISHSPVGYAVEAGLVEEEESLHHDDRHLVSNVIGSTEMHMSIGTPLVMHARDTLLVATDGLFDNLHKEEIVDIIRKGPLHRSCLELKDHCLGRMEDKVNPYKPDDLSFILFRPVSAAKNGR